MKPYPTLAPAVPADQRAHRGFEIVFGGAPHVLARAPGRVNLIGEHVDYNGGYVLPVAIDRSVFVAARPRDDGQVRAVALDFQGDDTFALDAAAPVTGWPAYVRGVAALLRGAGVQVGGAELAIAGDVPIGAGLSSSAALEVATATALLALAQASLDPTELALLCQRAEVQWAGVRCGVMDQFTAVLSRADHALFLDCRTLRYRHVPFPKGVCLVAADSGVRRDLKDSAYNRRFQECREAADMLEVHELCDIDPAASELWEPLLPRTLRKRARHVVQEIERTEHAADALEKGDLARVGRLMNASHVGLRDDFEVSTPELNALVDAAQRVEGVYGSRLTGGGFGGCTLSLVAEAALPAFLREVPAALGREIPIYVCRPSDGASWTSTA